MPKLTHPCTVIEVTGRGPFPLDMLRYDQCAPVNNEAVMAMEPEWLEDGRPDRHRTLKVVRLNCYAVGGPTEARWRSFNWTCQEVL